MIGVFDSGDGGLTVLKALVRRLPEQDFLYLGDHARAPIGGRDPEDIYNLTVANIDYLFSQGCRLVLLACNTASAVALRRLQQTWLPQRDTELGQPGRRVLGVLVPMVEAIARVPWNSAGQSIEQQANPTRSRVAIFATRRTVETGSYPLEIGLRAPKVEVVQQACPELVARIEAGASRDELRGMVGRYVEALLAQMEGRIPDTAVLGCTHYPLVAPAFAGALPQGVELLDQPGLVAESLADYLSRHPAFDKKGGAQHAGPPVRRFITTGSAEYASEKASLFFGAPVTFEHCAF
ncbi:glutamate racemase [Denitrobaculum tricleocarpae]|uniref:Glutamate racemase n=1 Tax=Denitrobaculum tricleocarpae TaxID=2591009 RepID=A0A545TWQ1_9PROT|nr:aspartate/glutamate racemase family protein [Denitrobaculum tricleocarpae]TQV81645.1 glutamate racemase [Denitrobaculum tricleocarpae]